MTMDYKYIEQLLEKYFECDTTLEEEQILRAFFAQQNVPIRLLPYRQLFTETARSKKEETLGSDFDNRILAIISEQESREPRRVKARIVTMQRRLRPLYKAAACVAVVLALGQAAQMPYTGDSEEQENIARTISKPNIMKQENTPWQRPTPQPKRNSKPSCPWRTDKATAPRHTRKDNNFLCLYILKKTSLKTTLKQTLPRTCER